MQASQIIWHNGSMIPLADSKVHVLSHTLHYGGGALEGIRFYLTSEGPAIFRLSEHIDRLLYSASILKMPVPYTKEEICKAIVDVSAASGLDEGYIRPIIFYGHGTLSINPTGNPVECVIACWSWESYFGKDQVDVKVSKYMRLHPDTTVIDAKLCAHYLNGILASLELQGTHYHDIIYMDHHNNISEGMGANFFIVKSNVIYTPKIGTILIGITRDTVFHLAKEYGIEIVETDINLNDAYRAEEAFFTGTAAEITAIRSINDNVIGDGIGKLTALLKEAYQNLVHGNHPNSKHYLTLLNKNDSTQRISQKQIPTLNLNA